LLSVTGDVRIVLHVELDVLQRCSLSHLPMDRTNVCVRIRKTNVHFEISDTSEKIALIDIPVYLHGVSSGIK
jgi:hypothetical protein